MVTTTEKTRSIVKERQIIRPRDLDEFGIPHMYLYRLFDQGEVKRISRGLYEDVNREITENTTIAMVSKRIPNGVVCLLSALQIYDVTTQSPHKVWIALDNSAWRPKPDAVPVRLEITYMSGQALTEGITVMKMEGVDVRVFNLGKTVVDCFKFRNKVGLDVAIEALKEVRRHKLVTSDELWHHVKICRMTKVMRPYLEAIG